MSRYDLDFDVLTLTICLYYYGTGAVHNSLSLNSSWRPLRSHIFGLRWTSDDIGTFLGYFGAVYKYHSSALLLALILKTEHQFNSSVSGSSYLSHVENNKNHFVMTIVMWIRVHPYKATHLELKNRNSSNTVLFTACILYCRCTMIKKMLCFINCYDPAVVYSFWPVYWVRLSHLS